MPRLSRKRTVRGTKLRKNFNRKRMRKRFSRKLGLKRQSSKKRVSKRKWMRGGALRVPVPSKERTKFTSELTGANLPSFARVEAEHRKFLPIRHNVDHRNSRDREEKIFQQNVAKTRDYEQKYWNGDGRDINMIRLTINEPSGSPLVLELIRDDRNGIIPQFENEHEHYILSYLVNNLCWCLQHLEGSGWILKYILPVPKELPKNSVSTLESKRLNNNKMLITHLQGLYNTKLVDIDKKVVELVNNKWLNLKNDNGSIGVDLKSESEE